MMTVEQIGARLRHLSSMTMSLRKDFGFFQEGSFKCYKTIHYVSYREVTLWIRALRNAGEWEMANELAYLRSRSKPKNRGTIRAIVGLARELKIEPFSIPVPRLLMTTWFENH